MYKLNNDLYFMIQRGVSDNLFIKYFDKDFKDIINPLNNVSFGWQPISTGLATFLRSIGEEV